MHQKFMVSAALLALMVAAPCFAQEESKEIYNAYASRSGPQPTGRSPIQITITRWTTESERNEVLAALVEKGQPGAFDVLQKQDQTGFLRISNRGGQRSTVPTTYAWSIEDGDKRRIVILADRYVPMFGSVMRPKNNQHNMTLITFEVDGDGKGEGTMVSGVKVKVDDTNSIVLDSALTGPIDLTNVEKTQ